MFVVVMGDLNRDTDVDQQQVLELLDELKQKYSDLTIVSGACKKGIGYFVRDRCIKDPKNLEFGFIEIDVRIWARLSQAKLAQVYMCRNPSIVEIGEVFEIFPFGGDKGHIPDLIERVKASGSPLRIHHRSGKIETFNYNLAEIENKKNTNETMHSSNLKSYLE